MAYQKLQVRDGLVVIPSATVNIPDPATEIVSSTTDGVDAGKLEDSSQNFIALGVTPGMIVYNTTDNTAAVVTGIDTDALLSLSVDIMDAAENYVIYGSATEGCILYVGGTGNLTAVMATDKDVAAASQKELTFENLPDASFLPIQVCRVDDTTTATNIIALF
tara:strand:- start:145 stop:633 length:489 start_codon:yes stop_codon:yes gene_type:complete